MPLRLLLSCLVLTSAAACGSTQLEELPSRGLFVTRRHDSATSYLVVSLSYDVKNSACYSGGGKLRGTFNGRDMVMDQGGRQTGFYNLGDCESPWSTVQLDPKDSAPSESVFELSDPSMTMRMRVADLFGPPWALSLQSPGDGVLRPGGEVVLTWQPSTYSLRGATPGCTSGNCSGPTVSFALSETGRGWSLFGDAISVSENTLRFRVPATAVAGSGRLTVNADNGLLSTRVLECTGAGSCGASLQGDPATASLDVRIEP